jgi:hypothetical protein
MGSNGLAICIPELVIGIPYIEYDESAFDCKILGGTRGPSSFTFGGRGGPITCSDAECWLLPPSE